MKMNNFFVLIILFINFQNVNGQPISLFTTYNYNNYDLIFECKVDSLLLTNNSNYQVFFSVRKSYKGLFCNKLWLISSSTDSEINKGSEYLVFANSTSDTSFTTDFSQTKKIANTSSMNKKTIEILEQQVYTKYKFKVSIDSFQNETINYALNSKDSSMFKRFYPNGNLEAIGHYSKGKAVDDWYYFFLNGFLKANGNYKNGKKEGLWKESYWNDIIDDIDLYTLETGSYYKGNRVGIWYIYDLKQNLIEQKSY